MAVKTVARVNNHLLVARRDPQLRLVRIAEAGEIGSQGRHKFREAGRGKAQQPRRLGPEMPLRQAEFAELSPSEANSLSNLAGSQ